MCSEYGHGWLIGADALQELALGSTGSRLARRKALGMGAGLEGRRRRRALGPVVGGMAEDGSYVGPGGGESMEGHSCIRRA